VRAGGQGRERQIFADTKGYLVAKPRAADVQDRDRRASLLRFAWLRRQLRATRGNEQGRPHAIRKMGQPAHIEMVDSIYYEFDDRSGPVRIVALDVTLPGNEQSWRNPRRHRGIRPRKSGSQQTQRWREADSNRRSPVRGTTLFETAPFDFSAPSSTNPRSGARPARRSKPRAGSASGRLSALSSTFILRDAR